MIDSLVYEFLGKFVDFVKSSGYLIFVDVVVPVERRFRLVTLLELDEFLLEAAGLVHNGVTDSLFESVDFLFDFADFLAKVGPFDVSQLDFFELFVEGAFVFGWVLAFAEVELLECLDGLFDVLLVAAHDFVDAFEVADVAQDVLEKVSLANVGSLLDALESELHEVVDVKKQFVGVVVEEVLP